MEKKWQIHRKSIFRPFLAILEVGAVFHLVFHFWLSIPLGLQSLTFETQVLQSKSRPTAAAAAGAATATYSVLLFFLHRPFCSLLYKSILHCRTFAEVSFCESTFFWPLLLPPLLPLLLVLLTTYYLLLTSSSSSSTTTKHYEVLLVQLSSTTTTTTATTTTTTTTTTLAAATATATAIAAAVATTTLLYRPLYSLLDKSILHCRTFAEVQLLQSLQAAATAL